MRAGVRPNNPEQAIAAAQRLVDDAEKAVEAESGRRLKELLSVEPHRRIDGLEDPALVPRHRTALRRSLQPSTPLVKRFHPLFGGPLARVRLHAGRRVRAALCGFGLVCGTLGLVTWNDGLRGTLDEPFAYHDVELYGSKVSGIMPAGASLLVVDRGGDRLLARWWIPSTGYITLPISRAVVTLDQVPVRYRIISAVSASLRGLWGARDREGRGTGGLGARRSS